MRHSPASTRSIAGGLSDPQHQLLKMIRDQPDADAWNLKQASKCSLTELGQLAEMGLIDIGTDRLEVDRMHPVITAAGLAALADTQAQPRQTVDTLSPALQIERLEEGRDRGCVTEEEFQRLKQEILDSPGL
jgi:hypothetical protein